MNNIVAIMYDFDHTLSDKDMQEYAYIPDISMTSKDFWAKCEEMSNANNMDGILAYMYVMINEARGKVVFTRDTLLKQGKRIKYFDGVENWFERINEYGEKLGMKIEHYIISSGLRKVIEGTSIAKYFKEIYACDFCYDDRGEPYWPSMAVNYTSKTQFLFRINKGVLDVRDDKTLNESQPEKYKRIPFSNMIYIGDGLTDVPCMKLTKSQGGHSIAVYQETPDKARQMIDAGRVDFMLKADYSENSPMDKAVKGIIDKIKADTSLDELAKDNYIANNDAR